MANTERARKLLVRSMVATGATVTTLFGAQNLAALDLIEADKTQIFETEVVFIPEVQATQELSPTATQLPPTFEPTIIHSAPSITILRQSGQAAEMQVNTNTSQLMIQPPNPVAIPQPDPIIIQPPTPEFQVPQVIQQPPQQQVVVVRRNSNSSSSRSSSSR